MSGRERDVDEIRILFTSVGRRVELMQAYRDAAMRLGIALRLYGGDVSDTAPALSFCDESRKTPRIDAPNYIDELVRLCDRDDIDVLIPTIDTDLLVLAKNRERFNAVGTRVLVSAPEFVGICRDKRRTAAFFKEKGLLAPETTERVEDYRGGFPCFIKPLNGSSSIDAYRCEDAEELLAISKFVPDAIIQPYISGEEYTVDIFCDFDGRVVFCIPRRRLAVRSGEVMKTKITMDAQIIEACERLIEGAGAVGEITVQLIRQRTNDEIRDHYIEINPRYGGGAPLSIRAGADTAASLLSIIAGKEPPAPHTMDETGIYVRFDQSIRVGDEPVKMRDLTGLADYIDRHGIKGVVLDLDDTLYPERDYIKSGFKQVALGGFVDGEPEDIAGELFDEWERQVREHGLSSARPIDAVFARHGVRDEAAVRRALDIYRDQEPDIKTYPDAEAALEALKYRRLDGEIVLGLITDGSPKRQRKKLAALGIEELFDEIIVTDEFAGNSGHPERFRKPEKLAFEVMRTRFGLPYGDMVYVGDNPKKDCRAPLFLGMKAILVERGDGIH